MGLWLLSAFIVELIWIIFQAIDAICSGTSGGDVQDVLDVIHGDANESVDEICDDLERRNPSLLYDLKNITVKTKKGDSANERYGPIIDHINGQSRIFWNYYRIERSNDHIDNMVESFFDHLNDMDSRGLVKRNLANTGDVFFFNDSRVLHGRDAFSATLYGDRILLQSMWRL